MGPETLKATSTPWTVVSRSTLSIGSIFCGVVERDGALVDGVFGSGENYAALRDGDAPDHAGMIRVAAEGEIGIGLQILREGGAELNVGRSLDLHVETHARQKARADGGGGRRGGGGVQEAAHVGMRVERHVHDGDRAGKQAARGGAGQGQPGSGLGGDGGRIGDADSIGIGLYAELHLRTAVGDKAGKREFSSAGFAGEILNHRLCAVEAHQAVRIGDSVGEIDHVERRILQLEPAVDHRLCGAAGDGGVEQHTAGGEDVGIDGLQDFQFHIAIDAQIEGTRLQNGCGTAQRESRRRSGDRGAADGDQAAIERRYDGTLIVQFELAARLFHRVAGDRVGLKLRHLKRAAEFGVRDRGPLTFTWPSSEASKVRRLLSSTAFKPE